MTISTAQCLLRVTLHRMKKGDVFHSEALSSFYGEAAIVRNGEHLHLEDLSREATPIDLEEMGYKIDGPVPSMQVTCRTDFESFPFIPRYKGQWGCYGTSSDIEGLRVATEDFEILWVCSEGAPPLYVPSHPDRMGVGDIFQHEFSETGWDILAAEGLEETAKQLGTFLDEQNRRRGLHYAGASLDVLLSNPEESPAPRPSIWGYAVFTATYSSWNSPATGLEYDAEFEIGNVMLPERVYEGWEQLARMQDNLQIVKGHLTLIKGATEGALGLDEPPEKILERIREGAIKALSELEA